MIRDRGKFAKVELNIINLKKPKKIISKIISPHDNFPGNSRYPLLIYKQVFSSNDLAEEIQAWLKNNDWGSSWIDSIYDFHHYHSNTHEVLVIIAGVCLVQFCGEQEVILTVEQGDTVIIPAGVAHKRLEKSADFRCIGAYPFDVGYDMNYGKKQEYADAIKAVKNVGLPGKDPIFGEKGLIFDYWK